MGYFIKELTYEQLRPLITERSVVVLPIGGGAKEHGNHLPMGTDYFVTDWVANAVTARENVLTLPTLPVWLTSRPLSTGRARSASATSTLQATFATFWNVTSASA